MKLPIFSQFANVWIEITRSEHGHGGPGWEFGTCLWSPSRDAAGHDRYAVMRQPGRGDGVIHFYHWVSPIGGVDTYVFGFSTVAKAAREVTSEPPSPGVWAGMAPYFRIDLHGFSEFPRPLPMATLIRDYGLDIRREIVELRPRFYPLATYGGTLRLTQGMYLARCTPNLYLILNEALGLEDAAIYDGSKQHEEYAEGIRRLREIFFFSRNQALVQTARKHYGLACQACGFDFASMYGALGDGYIECHHLSPLSERPEEEWTESLCSRLEDVTILCSNCHRMVHRRQPALSIKELKEALEVGSIARGNENLPRCESADRP
jgi:hypothetical protein